MHFLTFTWLSGKRNSVFCTLKSTATKKKESQKCYVLNKWKRWACISHVKLCLKWHSAGKINGIRTRPSLWGPKSSDIHFFGIYICDAWAVAAMKYQLKSFTYIGDFNCRSSKPTCDRIKRWSKKILNWSLHLRKWNRKYGLLRLFPQSHSIASIYFCRISAIAPKNCYVLTGGTRARKWHNVSMPLAGPPEYFVQHMHDFLIVHIEACQKTPTHSSKNQWEGHTPCMNFLN